MNSGSATTGARGEVSPLIPPTHVIDKPATSGSARIVAFVAGLALAVVGGVIVVKKLSPVKPPVEIANVPSATGASVAPTGATVVPTGAAVAPTGASVAPTGASVAPTGATVKPGLKIGAHPLANDKHEALPPEIKAELDDAEKKIDSDPQEAIRVARRSLQETKSPRAFSIVTRAFCKLGDLGNAKAQLHNVGGDRARVLKFCKAAGTDLQ